MSLYPYDGRRPHLGERVFVAPGAALVGEVTVGDDASFWFHTSARGDVNAITVGARTNVQDGSVLHVTHDRHPLTIGERVVIGHGVMLHGCTIEDGALVGIGATVLDGAVVGQGAQVAAGALVAPGQQVPAGHLAIGVPARVLRPLTDEEQRYIRDVCDRYVTLKDRYLDALSEPAAGAPAGG